MAKDASNPALPEEGRRNSRWWILCLLLFAAVVALAIAMVLLWPAREPATPGPLQVESTPWIAGEDVELTLRSELTQAGQVISATILAPGSGQPEIADLAPEYFGIAGVQISWLLPEYRETEMALAAATGARFVGLDLEWRRIEPQPGQYNWADTDEVVALAKRYGLRLVPMLLYTPHWASTAPYAPLESHRAPPTSYTDYRDFVYAVADRYKPYGKSPLTADGYGISDWVIWNEPNLRSAGEPPEPGEFWTGTLEEYLLLLRAGYEGAHAADPGCNVLNGGLADLFWAEPPLDMVTSLERLYDPNGDGDGKDGGRPFFDTLNLHTYQLAAPDANWYEDRLEAVRQVMERYGDQRKPIWITETGYGAAAEPGPQSPLVDEQTQADAVHVVYRAISGYSQVERVFWWSLRDYHANASAGGTEMEGHYGLLRARFEPKPAFLSYGQLTGSLGQAVRLHAVTDAEGVARVGVPASFVSQAGSYILFASVDEVAPAIVAMFEASAAKEQD